MKDYEFMIANAPSHQMWHFTSANDIWPLIPVGAVFVWSDAANVGKTSSECKEFSDNLIK